MMSPASIEGFFSKKKKENYLTEKSTEKIKEKKAKKIKRKITSKITENSR